MTIISVYALMLIMPLALLVTGLYNTITEAKEERRILALTKKN